jgi:insertion element IS1 protein InsB
MTYETVMPPDRHHAVGKESGQANPIERFNGTMRQRISRLVRKARSFSKKLKNHIGAKSVTESLQYLRPMIW